MWQMHIPSWKLLVLFVDTFLYRAHTHRYILYFQSLSSAKRFLTKANCFLNSFIACERGASEGIQTLSTGESERESSQLTNKAAFCEGFKLCFISLSSCHGFILLTGKKLPSKNHFCGDASIRERYYLFRQFFFANNPKLAEEE